MGIEARTPLPTQDFYAMLRNVHGYLRDPLGYLLRMSQQHRGLVNLRLPGQSIILVNAPDLIEEVLVNDSKCYGKDRLIRFLGSELLGQGLLTSDGDHWRRQRRLAQPAFHHDRIVHYAEIMSECGQRYVDSLQLGETRDLLPDMMQLTLDIVLRALLSISASTLSADISQTFNVLLERHAIGVFSMFPTLSKLPLPMNRRYARAVRHLDEIVAQLISERRQERTGTPRTDLLSLLLAAKDTDGHTMSDRQLRDEILTLFISGHETTALLLTYALMLLSSHPTVRSLLHQELTSVLGARAPTPADLPALPYTEAVLLETLRLYPPAYAIGREAICDTKLGGYAIERGSHVLISQWALHRNATFFEQPEAFCPARWLDGLRKRLPRFAYLPFGGGPRQCIGNAFAMVEATLLLATITRRFHLKVSQPPTRPVRFQLAVTLRPRDRLRVRVETL